MKTKITKDIKNYRELSEPFKNSEEANKAVTDFYEEVRELRKKYKIPDMLIVIKATVMYEDKEGQFITSSFYGDSLNQETMSAYAYGTASSEARELVNKLLKGNIK